MLGYRRRDEMMELTEREAEKDRECREIKCVNLVHAHTRGRCTYSGVLVIMTNLNPIILVESSGDRRSLTWLIGVVVLFARPR